MESLGNSPNHIIHNQIDFLTIKKQYRNSVKLVKTQPAADIHSDYTLLLAKISGQLKKVSKPNYSKKTDLSKLNDLTVQNEVSTMTDKVQ